jgi:hypothetical protein
MTQRFGQTYHVHLEVLKWAKQETYMLLLDPKALKFDVSLILHLIITNE